MEELELKTQAMVEEIHRKVDGMIEDLNVHYEREKERLINEYCNEAREETSVYLEQELNELKISVQMSESQAKWKVKKDLFVKRQEMVDQLFKDISKLLTAHSQSKTYDIWLKDSITREILNASIDFPIVIEYKPVDQPMIERLCADAIDKVELIKKETIFIGGFIVIDVKRGIEQDFTLDTRLKTQKEWFAIHSGLDF